MREMSPLAKSIYKKDEFLSERVPLLTKEIDDMKEDLNKVNSVHSKKVLEECIKDKENMLRKMKIKLEEIQSK